MNKQNEMTDAQALTNLSQWLESDFAEIFDSTDISDSDIEFAQVAAINTSDWDK